MHSFLPLYIMILVLCRFHWLHRWSNVHRPPRIDRDARHLSSAAVCLHQQRQGRCQQGLSVCWRCLLQDNARSWHAIHSQVTTLSRCVILYSTCRPPMAGRHVSVNVTSRDMWSQIISQRNSFEAQTLCFLFRLRCLLGRWPYLQLVDEVVTLWSNSWLVC